MGNATVCVKNIAGECIWTTPTTEVADTSEDVARCSAEQPPQQYRRPEACAYGSEHDCAEIPRLGSMRRSGEQAAAQRVWNAEKVEGAGARIFGLTPLDMRWTRHDE